MIKLTKLMRQVLAEYPETLKRKTVLKMEEKGIVTITKFWVIRGGLPGYVKGDGRPGQIVTYFEINGDVLKDCNAPHGAGGEYGIRNAVQPKIDGGVR